MHQFKTMVSTSQLKIPVRLVRDILQDLNSVNLVSIVQRNDVKEREYQPAMDINKLTVSYVLTKLDKKGIAPKGFIKTRDFEKIESILSKFDKLVAKSESNILIKDL